MSRPVELRVPLGVGERLRAEMFRGGSHEYVAFGLVGHARLATRDVVLVRDVVTLAEADYFEASGHGGAWRGAAMIPILTRAAEEGLGIIVFHAHDGAGSVHLSADDRASAARLLPLFLGRAAGRPHGSVVLGREAAGGIVQFPGEAKPRSDLRVRWYGQAIEDWPPAPQPLRSSSRFTRQEVVVGHRGQAALAQATVAVVGLGGGGSHVVQQLAHLGVGRFILIDHDHAEESNRHRLIGMTRADGLFRREKTHIARRVVRRIDRTISCVLVEARVPEATAVAALREADVIVGCVDNLDTRLDIQHLAQRLLVPYVDIGLSIRETDPGEGGPRVAIGGNVITYRPGGFCLWCVGYLNDEKLAMGRGNADRAYARTNAGAPGDAQVVSFNGVLASQAVNEVLQLLTGFAGSSVAVTALTHDANAGTLVGYKKLEGARGTLEEWGGAQKKSCRACAEDLGRGDLAWA